MKYTNWFLKLSLGLLILSIWVPPAFAHHLLKKHPLQCDNTFHCPEEIVPRVHFWVSVFSEFGTDRAIFHDTKVPNRIFSVIKTDASCSASREPRVIRNERRRIRNLLISLSRKLSSKKNDLTDEEQHIADLFPNGDRSREIRRAAERIRCQTGNKDRFEMALRRYGMYRDMIVAQLKKEGLSEDIQYLPFVESSYNPKAYSRVGATGIWQIMPGTAKRLGLTLNASVDERFDAEKSTLAAVQYLKNSEKILTDYTKKLHSDITIEKLNPFIITSYNYGVAGMKRAIRLVGPDFMDVLQKYKGRRFRVAVRNFYASFLAARHVAQNAALYFSGIQLNPPMKYSTIVVPRDEPVYRLSEIFGIPENELQELNPSLRRLVWNGRRPVPRNFELKVPDGKSSDYWDGRIAALLQLPEEELFYPAEPYKVQRGDTACGIARRFDVRCRDLMDENNLGRRGFIRIGQVITIPGKEIPREKRTVVAAVTEKAPSPLEKKKPQVEKQAPLTTPEKEPELVTVATRPPEKPEEPIKDSPVAKEEAEITKAKAIGDTLGINEALFVSQKDLGNVVQYSVTVQPEETLGHYADWLGIGYATRLRKINGLKYGNPIPIGRELKLPIANEDEKRKFEEKRIEYHRTLEDEFKQHFEITGQEPYRVKSGDSLWSLANENGIPLWLLFRFNPDALQTTPKVGDEVSIPVVQARKEEKDAAIDSPQVHVPPEVEEEESGNSEKTE